MPSSKDVRTIDDGKVSPKRRFDQRDFTYLAEYVIDEHDKRKTNRGTREKHWKEIDRQIAMEPDIAFKKMPDGSTDATKKWMAEMELPLQAQALEVLTADSRRMKFPDSGPWFRAHAETTDEYLRKADFQSLVLGDENEVPSQINQDNADKLVEGYLLHLFAQYDFYGRHDLIDAEAFKYGMGVGRARMETKNVYINEARGVRKEIQKIPVLVPVSIKNLYLDDPMPSMHTAQMLGPAHIAEDNIKLANLILAANKGSIDPDDEDGGWMPTNVSKLVDDGKGYVKILEMEGDIVVPRRTTRSVVIPGAIVTVAIGGASGGKATNAVIRFRFRKMAFSSYLLHPYHYEHVDDPYPTSPLMKGRPIQMAATDALNRLMDASALKNGPPIGYDKNDPVFAAAGGPEIYPGAQWGTSDPAALRVHTEIGGEPASLANVFGQLVNLYAELTGVLPARLGAQTTSHTTAFAKDAELQRGAIRTVDYVRQCGEGPITRWLDMAYQMGRGSIKKNEEISFFIAAYGGFVKIDRDHLPERAVFEWFGSGGPAEEQTKVQMRLQSLQLALKMDQIAISTGKAPTLNMPAAIREVLREGTWIDLDAITSLEATTAPPALPLPVAAAVQTLTGRGGQVSPV